MDANRMIVFFGSILGVCMVVDIFKILLAKKLNNKLTPDRIYRMKKAISLLLIVFGIFLVAQGLIPEEIKEIKETLEKVAALYGN